jgi:RNA-directed DNA polymerase
MGTASKPPGKAMYVAPKPDWDWLRIVQRKLYARSEQDVAYVFCKLWGLVTDSRNLRMALARVAGNRGRRTAGVDGITVVHVAKRAEAFIAELRSELRSGAYRPSPVRRVLIPKIGTPGKFRPLGIPTVKDRIVQAALKSILEPVFEADFFPVSYGFRPGKSVHGALEHLRLLLRPKPDKQGQEQPLPYQWVVEGDIKGCFDNINHHGLMERVRRRVVDPKVNRLIVAFLKAGIMSEGMFLRSDAGTPQGGILSPLLANIALSVIEERYERHVLQRRIAPTRRDAAPPDRRAKEARNGSGSHPEHNLLRTRQFAERRERLNEGGAEPVRSSC